MEDFGSDYLHLLPPSSILTPLRSHSKEDALEEMFAQITLLRRLDEVHGLKKAVIAREALGNTGIGHGVAVAHGKLESLTDIFLCLGVSVEGIDYGAYDGRPVHLLFAAANPPCLQNDYLKTLSRLSRFLHIDQVRERLIHTDAHILREILREKLSPLGERYPVSA